jgi:hypothetical protein
VDQVTNIVPIVLPSDGFHIGRVPHSTERLYDPKEALAL